MAVKFIDSALESAAQHLGKVVMSIVILGLVAAIHSATILTNKVDVDARKNPPSTHQIKDENDSGIQVYGSNNKITVYK